MEGLIETLLFSKKLLANHLSEVWEKNLTKMNTFGWIGWLLIVLQRYKKGWEETGAYERAHEPSVLKTCPL